MYVDSVLYAFHVNLFFNIYLEIYIACIHVIYIIIIISWILQIFRIRVSHLTILSCIFVTPNSLGRKYIAATIKTGQLLRSSLFLYIDSNTSWLCIGRSRDPTRSYTRQLNSSVINNVVTLSQVLHIVQDGLFNYYSKM